MLKRDAIKHYGSVLALSKALGITRCAVYLWKKYVPKTTAFRLHVMTEGALPVRENDYPKKRRKKGAKTIGRPPRKTNGEGAGEAISPTPSADISEG